MSLTQLFGKHQLFKNMYSLYPSRSFVKNIGFDGSGTHNKNPVAIYLNQKIDDYKMSLKKVKIEENKNALRYVINFHRREN